MAPSVTPSKAAAKLWRNLPNTSSRRRDGVAQENEYQHSPFKSHALLEFSIAAQDRPVEKSEIVVVEIELHFSVEIRYFGP
jgi:hypothetical protein